MRALAAFIVQVAVAIAIGLFVGFSVAHLLKHLHEQAPPPARMQIAENMNER